jgi:sugar (pentulose or hexulose) kinase
LGLDWDTVLDTVTLPRLRAYRKQWRRYPPVRVIAAVFAGYKAPREAAGPAEKPGAISIASLQHAFPNGRL